MEWLLAHIKLWIYLLIHDIISYPLFLMGPMLSTNNSDKSDRNCKSNSCFSLLFVFGIPHLYYSGLRHGEIPGACNSLDTRCFQTDYTKNVAWAIAVKLYPGESHRTSSIRSQHYLLMEWCHQETSHCRNQWWPRSVSRYGVTRPQYVNCVWLNQSMITRSLSLDYPNTKEWCWMIWIKSISSKLQ